MRHAKRAIVTIAVTNLNYFTVCTVFLVTSVAKVMCSEAVPQGNITTEHAFPVNVSNTMLITKLLAGSICLDSAVLASETFFVRVLLHVKLLLAIYHATKVGLLTVVALIKGAVLDFICLEGLLLSNFIGELFD